MTGKSLVIFCFLATYSLAQELPLNWHQLADVPDRNGLASGFAGTSGSTLLFGGGANFPDRLPWEGGSKVWYDRVWALDKPDAAWREVGRLPRPLGYGVTISTGEGVICVGGSDAERHYADVFEMKLQDARLVIKSLPSLPKPVANACGALIGSTIYIAGGIESPQATSTLKTFYALDLSSHPGDWIELESWPGSGRMLAVSAVQNGCFFLVSGTDLSADSEGKPMRRYLNDGYRFDPKVGWSRIADIPPAAVAAPSPAPTIGASQFLVIGGDDGSKVGFQPVQDHPGFSKEIYSYNTLTNKWTPFGYTPAPRVTAPVVHWGEHWLILSGEMRPGVRSAEVWSVHASTH